MYIPSIVDLAAKEETDRARLPVPEHFSKALYTMDIGQNDLAAGFRKMNMEQLHAAIPDIVNQLTAQVRVSSKTFYYWKLKLRN